MPPCIGAGGKALAQRGLDQSRPGGTMMKVLSCTSASAAARPEAVPKGCWGLLGSLLGGTSFPHRVGQGGPPTRACVVPDVLGLC